MEARNALKAARERRGIPAAELARQIGVSRQSIYAMEAGSYAPNTTIALQLAKALEATVEELFRLEPGPPGTAPPLMADLLTSGGDVFQGQPLRLCRVGKRTIAIPAIPHPVYLPASDGLAAHPGEGAGRVSVRSVMGPVEYEKRILVAGCDPGISVLSQHLQQSGNIEVVAAACSSRLALEWLKEGKVHIAGSHLRDVATGAYNIPAVRRLFPKGGFHMVTFAKWEQGIVAQRGNPKNIRGVEDLSRKDVALMNREVGSGSRELLDQKLKEAGIRAHAVRGYKRTACGHLPAAFAVSSGQADCCVATRSAAQAFGLHFIPLAAERYDLVMLRRYVGLPGIQVLLDALNRSILRRKLEAFAGYDTSQMGAVRI